MRRIQLVLGIMMIATVLGQQAQAADPWELINSFLEATSGKASETSDTAIDATPVSSTTHTDASDDSIRVAQRQKSVLRLGDEKVSGSRIGDSSSPLPTVPTSADEKKAAAEKKRIETGIDRKMSALERSLAREEKKLESRFESLNKKREVALEKGDEKMLKQIEALEKKAVVEYERKVQRLLASAEPVTSRSPIQQSVGKRKSTAPNSTIPSWQLNRQSPSGGAGVGPKAAGAAERPDAPPQRRRLRLWPFGR